MIIAVQQEAARGERVSFASLEQRNSLLWGLPWPRRPSAHHPAASPRKLPYVLCLPKPPLRPVVALTKGVFVTQFTDLGLAEPLLRAVGDEGYTTPTPIQAAVIPTILERRDVIGIAQTGTGKTASFVLPILSRIRDMEITPQRQGCTALILTPTRELAAQIADNIRIYGRYTKPAVAVVVGGVKQNPQIRAMAPGVDILVATPGRLLDHMSSGSIKLHGTSVIVLDEGDQMLDLGFVPAIREVMASLPKDRQTMLFSATMPKQIRALASDFLTNPAEVSVAPVSKPIDRIEQRVMHMPHSAKRDALQEVLSAPDMERAIVFTRTKRGADRVSEGLIKAGLKSAAIHGNKSQSQRERALRDFKAGKVNIMVATDIAARGIDIDDVSHVVNFELPNLPEAYVHRIGRTARAGRSGVAISFCDGTERQYLIDIEKLTKMTIEASGDPQPFEKPPVPGANRQPRNKITPGKPGGSGQRKPPRGGGGQRKPAHKAEGGAGKPGGENRPKRQRRRRPAASHS